MIMCQWNEAVIDCGLVQLIIFVVKYVLISRDVQDLVNI